MIISNLLKTLGKFTINIKQLELDKPEIYGLIGPNGSGKSTAAKLIAGILPYDKGNINYEGLNLSDITMITQKPYIMDDSIYNNLVYPLKIRGLKPDKLVCENILRYCGLHNRQTQNARNLSGGERQKLALCRAMIFQPKMIIADEVFTDLDTESVDLFLNIILDMQKQIPITWLIISHQIQYIKKLCNYLFFLSNGKIEVEGTIPEIFNSQNPFIKKYLDHYHGVN